MTKRTFSAALFLLIALASAAFALDINGKWKGNLASPNGDLETTMVFKVDGEKLTGTVTNTYGEEQITEGSVKGDDVNFIVNAGGGQFKIIYKGKITGEDIKLATWAKAIRWRNAPDKLSPHFLPVPRIGVLEVQRDFALQNVVSKFARLVFAAC